LKHKPGLALDLRRDLPIGEVLPVSIREDDNNELFASVVIVPPQLDVSALSSAIIPRVL
jgi:hypothetical protein